MLRLRLITGPILIALLLAIVALDDYVSRFAPGGLVLLIVSLIVGPLAAVELSRVMRANGVQSRAWLMALAVTLGLIVMWLPVVGADEGMLILPMAALASAFIVVLIVSLVTFAKGRNVQGVLAGAGGALFAMVYLGVTLGFFLVIARHHSAWWIVGIILTTKSYDIGAYFTGSAIGRHKMIPWLSPGKTWEGFAGGVATAMLVGMGFAMLSTWLPEGRDHVAPVAGLVLGAVFGVVGQFGDLVMSLLKRGGGLKDTSNILPGMGGLLDVLDSPIMVAPVAFWLLVRLGSA